MASVAMRAFVDRVLGATSEEIDLELVGLFMVDPEKALAGFELDAEEREALLARDVEALERIGIRREVADGVLSSPWAHSPRCPKQVIDAGWWQEGA